ncbi:MAG: PAS domain S-box protein, partial [Methanobacterium sp.]
MRYGGAILGVIVAFWLYGVITAWFGPGLPTYILFYPVVIVVALLAGFGPGLLATAMAVMVAGIWILSPYGEFTAGSSINQVGVVLFGTIGVMISSVAELYHRNRKKAAAYDKEMALRETKREKEFLVDVLEHASQPFAIGYLDGRVGLFNQAFEQLTGYSTEELHTIDWSANLTPEEWRELEKQKLDELQHTGQPVRYEKEYIRKDGSHVPIELLVHIVSDNEGKPKYYYSFITDISERKKAEEELKKRAALLDVSYEAIFSWDYEGKILSWNQGAERLYGYNGNEVIGKVSHDLLKTKFPAEFNELMDVLINEKIWTGELIHTTKDGNKIIVESRQQLITDTSGKKIVIETNRDITEHKKLDEELRKSHDELELKVEERTAELDVLIDELKRSNKELQQFAYVSSHDLQEPLRTIASFTQLLERRYKGQLDSDADEFMDYIVNAAKRMQTLINDLLQYSRVTTKGKEFQSVDVNEVLDTVLSNLKTSIDENNAEITVDNLPTLMADDSQLIQLFQNLIGNAIKFKKVDEPPKIHISARKDEDKNDYIFTVADNGIGMEPQYAERIFVIFQRLHTMDVYKGTGIGLSVAKKIVERHGGHIWVESEFGV